MISFLEFVRKNYDPYVTLETMQASIPDYKLEALYEKYLEYIKN